MLSLHLFRRTESYRLLRRAIHSAHRRLVLKAIGDACLLRPPYFHESWMEPGRPLYDQLEMLAVGVDAWATSLPVAVDEREVLEVEIEGPWRRYYNRVMLGIGVPNEEAWDDV